jgi:hypothetical protein
LREEMREEWGGGEAGEECATKHGWEGSTTGARAWRGSGRGGDEMVFYLGRCPRLS